MFSSHTIYTLTFILTISKYWPYKPFIAFLVAVQITIAFLIVAARKHYSIDVFTALYVVPLIWFTLEAYHKDINNKDVEITPRTIREFYDIDLTEEVEMQTSMHLDAAQITMVEEGRSGLPGDIQGKESFERKNSL